ncbi:MAG: hypothetical protein IJ544_01670 [Prevotella sp.]|nr:hypothetical protein [Prevotella sp.]
MNRLRLKRRLAARWLLAVFLPMLLLSSVHVHEQKTATHDYCEACAQHVFHFEKMATAHFSMHDCVLCQFHSVPFVAGLSAVLPSPTASVFTTLPSVAVALSSSKGGIHLGRAPPRCF